MKMILSN